MSLLSFEAPLAWPAGYSVTPRAQQRSDHGFSAQMSLDEAIGFLDEEVDALAPQSALLTSDVDNLRVARLRKKTGARSGTSLQMKWRGTAYRFACDRWVALEHNIYALHLALRALRNLERWGAATLPQAMYGFSEPVLSPQRHAAMPAAGFNLEDWMQALGLGPTATIEDATAVYHRRAKQLTHDSDAMARLNQVMDEARKKLAVKE